VGGFVPSPVVVIFDKFVRRSRDDRRLSISLAFGTLGTKVDFLEVVVFAFIEIGEIPEESHVLETEVGPLVVVGVVRYLIFMYSVSLSPGASHADNLTRVTLLRSAALVTVLSRDPSTVNNNGGSLNLNGVLSSESIFKGKFTSLVTVERVHHVEAFMAVLLAGYENFFANIELTQDEVGLHSVINIVFFIGHAPPCEVHCLPGGAVSNLTREAVVTLRALELLSEEETVLRVGDGSR